MMMKMINFIKVKSVCKDNVIPFNAVKTKLRINIKQKRYTLVQFNSESNTPIFNFGFDEFILACDSFPV